VEVREIADGERLTFAELEVGAFEVDHRPVAPAFGFEFAARGRRLVFSGDTRPCAGLENAARGADLLLHEVFVHRDLPALRGVRSAETVARVASYHTASSEVGRTAAAAGVGALVLTHIVPPASDRGALLDEVAGDYSGAIIVGEDLMSVDLARGRVSHGAAHLGLARRHGRTPKSGD
jgi:ribonuclease Z